MDYQALNELYLKHVQENDDWLGSLYKGAIDLRKQIGVQLNEPQPWINQASQPVPYINLKTLGDRNGEPKKLTPTEMSANEDGVFAFTISFTFEKAPKSFPKNVYWLAIGAKAINHEIHYTAWDTSTGRPQSNSTWVKGVVAGADMVIDQFVEYLSFDPASDLSNRRAIGFV